MMQRFPAAPCLLAAALLACAAATAARSASPSLPLIDDANLKPQYAHVGGADPQASDKTVQHWFGTFVDASNRLTYGFNMVGVNPASNGSATVPVDVVPLTMVFAADGGAGRDGAAVVGATLASPIFQTNDYSTTAASSGGAGALSAGNVGQYEDAIMRSQFNKLGSSYHLRLGAPTVRPAVTIQVPQNQGFLALNQRGIEVGLANSSWFSAQLNNLLNKVDLDPTHLVVFLTNNTILEDNAGNCCVVGFHGAAHATGAGTGKVHSNGGTSLQTFVFASYTTPGTFNPAKGAFVKDIHVLSHEIAEWGDDPFVDNTVEPWTSEVAPQYGCVNLLETGDPLFATGFAIGTNSFDTNAFSDRMFHPSDEAFLPWFARQTPNAVSQPLQGGTTGRYSFMGDLNPSPVFQAPAVGC
jgi:hypothetical protein